MKRLILMVTVALVVAAMLAVMAMPALAAIHPLARMECAQDSSQSSVVETQDPPGLVSESHPQNIAQPIFSVAGNDTAANHAFKDDVCPAPQK
jgi:hypothetical protein